MILENPCIFMGTLMYMSLECHGHLKEALGRKSKPFLSDTHEYAVISCKDNPE